MMISPETYIDNLTDYSYEDLMKERDELIRSIHDFEEREKAGDWTEAEQMITPSPEVRYQLNLDYLARLCAYMSEKFNDEYVWGGKRLSDR